MDLEIWLSVIRRDAGHIASCTRQFCGTCRDAAAMVVYNFKTLDEKRGGTALKRPKERLRAAIDGRDPELEGWARGVDPEENVEKEIMALRASVRRLETRLAAAEKRLEDRSR